MELGKGLVMDPPYLMRLWIQRYERHLEHDFGSKYKRERKTVSRFSRKPILVSISSVFLSESAMVLFLPILFSCLILLVNGPTTISGSLPPRHLPDDPENVAGFLYKLISAAELEKARNQMKNNENNPSVGSYPLFVDPFSSSLTGDEATDQMIKKAEPQFYKFFGKRGFKPYSGK